MALRHIDDAPGWLRLLIGVNRASTYYEEDSAGSITLRMKDRSKRAVPAELLERVKLRFERGDSLVDADFLLPSPLLRSGRSHAPRKRSFEK